MTEPTVQSLFRPTRVDGATAPYDTAHVTVYYPAGDGEADAIGTRPVDASARRWPVVLFLPGMNTEPSYYRWLGLRLAREGFAFVTYSFIGEVPPRSFGITPGVDMEAVKPDTFGTRPVGRVIGPVLRLLGEIDAEGPLAGRLDLDHVAVGGHSAGGTVSLESADHRFFPQIKAVYSYASHTMASTVFGWPVGTVLPLSGDCPALVMSGTNDGIVAASARWYGEGDERVDPIERTFDTLPEGGASSGSYLLAIKGANHFSVVHPEDGGWPRGGDDLPAGTPGDEVRALVGDALTLFLRHHLLQDAGAGASLATLLQESSIAAARSR